MQTTLSKLLSRLFPPAATVVALLFCLPATSHAIFNNWSSSGPAGAVVKTLAIDPATPATIYAGTGNAGVYKSTNGGSSWNSANTGLPSNSVINALRLAGSTLYAGSQGNGLFKSIGGVSWSTVNGGWAGTATISAVVGNGADIYVAINGGGVYKGASGTTWNSLNSTGLASGNILSLAVVPTATATLYAGSNGSGAFRSIDDGTTWTPLNNGLPGSSTITALTVDSSGTPIIYAGTDQGKVYWIANNSGFWSETTAQPSSGVAINAIVTRGTELYVMTAGKGLFRSSDGGATWSPLNSTLPNTTVTALALDPINSFNLYLGSGGGIFKSTDSGTTWADSNSGLLHTDIRAFAINPTTQSIVYACSGGGGVFKSSNGGATWLPVNTGLTNTFVNAIAIDSVTPSTLYVATSGGIFTTTNSGTNWTAATTQPTTLDVRALVIEPGNPATLYAGTTGGGIFHSTNSGDTWAAYNAGLSDLNVVALAVSASDLFAATRDNGIVHWGGAAWATVNNGLTSSSMNALSIDTANPSTLFAGTNDTGVFKTVNSASTWNAFNSGISALAITSFVISSTAPPFVTTGTNGGGVFFTTNGGTSWASMNTGLTDLAVNTLAANTASTKKVYAGTANSGIFALNVSQISTVTPAGPTPASAVDFGKTNIGDTKGIDFTMGNSGTVALQLSSPSFAGADSTLFTVSGATTGSPCNSFPLTIAAGGSCTIKVNFTPSSIGTKTASLVVASDAPNQPITVYLKGDAGPPPQAAITAPAGTVIRSPFPVAGTAVDNGGSGLAKVEVSFDSGATWSAATITPAGAPNWNWNYSWTASGNGSYGIRARATDNNGFVQTNFTGLTKTVTVDNTPPVTTITANPPLLDNLKNGSFSFSADKGGSAFECRIGSGAFASCSSPYAYSGLSDGVHTFNVQAYDGIPPAPGNKEATPQSYSWTVDTVPPTTTITGKPAAFTQSNMATIVFAANETSTYSCTLDGGASAPCTTPYNKGPLAEGSHSFTVQAIDQAGNHEITPASYTWIVDTIKPTSTTSAIPAQLTGATYSFTGTASDGGSGVNLVEVSFNGNTWYPATDTAVAPAIPWSSWSYLWTLPINGTYTLQVRSTDKAGNQQQQPASTNINIANPLPTLAITAPVNNTLVSSASARVISGTAAPNSGGLPLQKVQVSVFPTANPPGTPSWNDAIGTANWSYNWTLPADGLYTVQAQALDSAGNPFAVDSNNVTVDITPPVSTIDPPANTHLRGGSITLTGTANDNLTGVKQVEIVVNDSSNVMTTTLATYNAVTKGWSFTSGNLPDGSYRIQSRATDNAGNQQVIPVTMTITLDNVPPVTTLTEKPVNPSNSPAPIFTFAANETVTYSCTLDGVAAPCTSPKNYASLTTGSHTFSVQATDLAGNVEPTPPTYSWFVDLVKPVVTAVTPADGGKRISVTGSPITVTFSKALDPATITTASFYLDNEVTGTVSFDQARQTATFIPSRPLAYTATYRVTLANTIADTAGNTLQSPYSWSFTTDPDGDINMDGKVDIADALLAMQVTVGLQKLGDKAVLHGDVGPLSGGKPLPDGLIDGRDALVILGKAIGLHNW